MAVRAPLLVEMRRLRGNADVLDERRDDGLVPELGDAGSCGGGGHRGDAAMLPQATKMRTKMGSEPDFLGWALPPIFTTPSCLRCARACPCAGRGPCPRCLARTRCPSPSAPRRRPGKRSFSSWSYDSRMVDAGGTPAGCPDNARAGEKGDRPQFPRAVAQIPEIGVCPQLPRQRAGPELGLHPLVAHVPAAP